MRSEDSGGLRARRRKSEEKNRPIFFNEALGEAICAQDGAKGKKRGIFAELEVTHTVVALKTTESSRVRRRQMKSDFPQCTDVFTSGHVIQHVQQTQASMIKSIKDCFSASEIDDLRCVVRLTIEFHYYLEVACDHSYCSEYVSESIFCGIESFMHLTRGYDVLVGAMKSQLAWDAQSLPLLKEKFAALFDKFEKEEVFETKWRYLLDLFKLQIVFTGIVYD